MDKVDTKFYQRVLMLIVVCLVSGYLFYHLNRLVGFVGDDFLYHFQYNGEWPSTHTRVIKNPWDLLVSIYVHTKSWNGRFVADAFIQLAMQFSKNIFNVINSFMFVVTGLLINMFVEKKIVNVQVSFLALTYLLMALLIPDFGHSMLWMSGACNYLWLTPIYLVFLLPFRWEAKDSRFKSPYFTISMVILGFLSGATNENIGPVIVIVAYTSYISDEIDNRKSYKYWGFLSSLIGALIMLMNNSGEALNQRGHPFQIFEVLKATMNYDGYLLIIIVVVSIWAYYIFKDRYTIVDNLLIVSLIAFISASLSVGALILSPQFPGRTWYGATIFGIICFLCLLRYIQKYVGKKMFILVTIVNVILIITTYPNYLMLTNELLQTSDSFRTEVEIIKKNRRVVVRVPGINGVESSYNPYSGTAYLESGSSPSEHWENAWMAKFYHSKGIVLDESLPIKHFERDSIDKIAEDYDKNGIQFKFNKKF
ncbi:DUF3329 domain-containing protein [Lactiplantibacillus plantarum]|uniref:DUF3329 domain-containing protein n=1 Tax=Lactiplantibacillus plantarum TaxID=1590 RepID=UPI0021A4470C|nr:DUF6056 family protein [Lactiplantibacillus plantarum]